MQYGLHVSEQGGRLFGRGTRTAVTIFAAIVIIVVIAWWLMVPAADWLAQHDVGPANGTVLINARNNARGSLLTLSAGVVAVGALVFTARNFLLSRRALELTERGQRRSFELSEQAQVTDRYTKAIEQLGSDKLDIRIGGIYALERIALDSTRDHPTIMEVLSTFIREHSREQEAASAASTQHDQALEDSSGMRADVQAAVTVLGRRNKAHDTRGINLIRATLVEGILPGADFDDAHLSGADLTRATLVGASLVRAFLRHADLTRANLTVANLRRADLANAHLNLADLTGADLTGACLTRADLRAAHLSGADLTRADLTAATLSQAILTHAHLISAVLFQADLTSAHLGGADLTGASLGGADLTETNLTETKLTDAHLGSADLTRANLSGADLIRANLISAKLTGADLVHANLSGADLTRAKLANAKLHGADLTDVTWNWPAVPEGWRLKDGRLQRAEDNSRADGAGL